MGKGFHKRENKNKTKQNNINETSSLPDTR